LEGPLDGFEEFALGLRDTGYLGLNVTIPFKLDASKLADSLTGRARLAGAVNTLKFDEDTIYGRQHGRDRFSCATSRHRLGFKVASAAILVLGRGAVECAGLIASLLEEKPKWIAVANRTQRSGPGAGRRVRRRGDSAR